MTNVSAVEKMAELMQQMEENSPRVAALQYCLTQVAEKVEEAEKRNAELEARCAALAAENAGLKALARGWANATDDRLFEEHGEIFHDSIEACEEELKTICPVTDAFLAEVRSGAVDEVCLKISNAIVNCYQDEQVGLDAAATICGDFADELRKGVQS
ncbi:TPA: hypothetical protein ACPZ1K_002667 [Enterobacter hormaechei subsp. xiangfangensis]|uniref:hypothetical protein n=1 Tax=Enterobacter hormaechei TaxID=158836 RepID=UPI00285B772B|nr:hypothetical protein [Enterobacter hormaechei]ELD3313605.1 hypothetical protein [Enterobacter hormaechei]ELD3471555.1 hypothetical protein [Enterobacter hormaechei]ELD3484422.1 hypothetical protein [Enterobacter hormaechei]MDR9958864.1 hypothetical protein [Enterobacter hormaechei subsp. xiangfangensis]MDS0074616.1 hypothetical protein [Enterobacter hormaechei subsp. xiangfangensis]